MYRYSTIGYTLLVDRQYVVPMMVSALEVGQGHTVSLK